MNRARIVFTSSRRDDAEAVVALLAAGGVRARAVAMIGEDLLSAAELGKPLPSAGFDVLVAHADASQAEAILKRFTDWSRQDDDHALAAPPEPRPPALPRECCPNCGRGRTTACPWCGAAGSDFPDADPPPWSMEDAAVLLLCPQCDEPFVPRYLNRCEWCEHVFENGVDSLEPAESQATELVQGAAAALAATGIGVALFLMLLAALSR